MRDAATSVVDHAGLSRGRRRRYLHQSLEGWLYASPWILGFLLFTAGPMIMSLGLSFSDWNLLRAPEWVGLDNYRRLVTEDDRVGQALKVTTVYAVSSVPLQIFFGLVLAMLLNTNVRGLRLYRTLYYLPAVLSGVAVALLWNWIYSPDFGVLNYVLWLVGISGPAWLSSETWALPALIGMTLWHVGGGMVIYLAGLQGIPSELHEAAEVDGATWWHRMWAITVPLMTPVLFFQLVIGLIRALQEFTNAYVMTGGGPADATLMLLLYLYQEAFELFHMGYASALAWVLFIYILALTLIVFRSSSAWVYYEGELKGR